MRFGKVLFLLAGLSTTGWASSVTVGSLLYANPLVTGFQGFEVLNETGLVDGCDASSSIPVCTPLAFANTSLTVTLSDNSTITRTPSGGFSFGPGAYIYGTNAGDDPAQSFLFDPALTIVSAVFSGNVSPDSFQITDGTSQTTFFSTGTFSVTLDLSNNPSLIAADINTSSAGTSVPEPAGGICFLLGVSLFALIRRDK